MKLVRLHLLLACRCLHSGVWQLCSGMSAIHAHPNRLAREKSPYLLQHQHNPVEWFPWGEEAWSRARQEDKPILLSIGYSTCHWCHVMERESFEDPQVGAFLNEHFVSIKVDREERPDVDKIYMTFVQATTGQGGWPLNVFLTPDLKPFFGGTYFPPENRHGRPGFLTLLQQLRQVWRERRDEISASASDIHERLRQVTSQNQTPGNLPGQDALRKACNLFKQVYDPHDGGFGAAPKFPQPGIPQLLLRCAARFQDEEVKAMVLHTCERMAAGGINDQLGGGFSRYSVDAQWLVPHFEKMLYDNAQLVHLYLDAHLVSGHPVYAKIARDIIDYVLRDMTHADGGFFSAEDADSEGHEGKFYCWTREELARMLSGAELAIVVRHFGITEAGNFVDHSHPEPLLGQNVLSLVDDNLDESEKSLLESARLKMIQARARRVRPHRDDKVLASWNGLMLGAIARASAVLNEPLYLASAEKNLAFLKSNLWDAESRKLYHRWREGERDQVQLLEAYAFLLAGAIDLYEATLVPAHLDFSVALADAMLARFYDAELGGFWQSDAGSSDLILRLKEDYDGAEPSGNSVATIALLKLGSITGQNRYTEAAQKTLRFFAGRLEQSPQALPCMLQALDLVLGEPQRVVIAGAPRSPATHALIHAVHSVYQPRKVVLGTHGEVEPFAKTLPSGERPLAYICTGAACQPPTGDPDAIRKLLLA